MASSIEPAPRHARSTDVTAASLHLVYSQRLMRFFRSYRLSEADAEDLTQEVFVRLSGSSDWGRLRNSAAFVFTLARNLLRDRARRSHIRALSNSVPAEDAGLACEGPTPDMQLEQEELLGQVQLVLDSLKPKTRHAFVMHRIDGDSYAVIAAGMDISISMVEKHVMEAIAALKRLQSLQPMQLGN